MAKTVAVIQARMTSSRLPSKTLLPIHGRAMLLRVFDRLAFCKRLDSIVVATSDDPANEPIRAVCQREGIGCVSAMSSDEQVVGRLLEAARATSADAIVRVTPDCPLVDPGLVDLVVATAMGERDFPLWQRNRLPSDYCSNVFPRTYPDGLDCEFITAEALAALPEAEDATRTIWEHPEGFRITSVTHREDLSALRWTVDDARDLEFVRWVYASLPEGFTWRQVLALDEIGPWRERLLRLEPAVNPVHARFARPR